jgi:hypothetical protein
MSSLFFISTVSTLSLFIYLWLYTDFMGHYLKILKPILPKKIYLWLMPESFLNFFHESISFESYIEYLNFQKQGFVSPYIAFILKLISCQICLCTWVSIIFAYFSYGLSWTGIIFLLLSFNIFLLKFFLKKV